MAGRTVTDHAVFSSYLLIYTQIFAVLYYLCLRLCSSFLSGTCAYPVLETVCIVSESGVSPDIPRIYTGEQLKIARSVHSSSDMANVIAREYRLIPQGMKNANEG